MIRINLLGLPKAKGKRAGVASAGGGGVNIMVVALIVAVLTAAGNYIWYSRLQSEAAKLQKQMQDADRESRRLADVKAKFFELKKQKETLERRVNVIHELQKNQSGPSELLTMIGDTVNKTDAVWLRTMKDDGSNINLAGTALSVNAVANLMKNLKQTGQFKTVELTETFQDDSDKNMQAFQFTLVCAKKPQAKC